jgi:uncharacterized membrane protein
VTTTKINSNNDDEIALSNAPKAREADELEALLGRTAAGFAIAAPHTPTNYTSNYASIGGGRFGGDSNRAGHRKSYTVFGGGNFLSQTGDLVRGFLCQASQSKTLSSQE